MYTNVGLRPNESQHYHPGYATNQAQFHYPYTRRDIPSRDFSKERVLKESYAYNGRSDGDSDTTAAATKYSQGKGNYIHLFVCFNLYRSTK